MSADRDWDKELAAIDKVMAKAPAAPAKQAALPPGSGALPPMARSESAAVTPVGRRAAFFTWLRVLLAVAVAAGMTQWPYLHDCGTSFFLYLGAEDEWRKQPAALTQASLPLN